MPLSDQMPPQLAGAVSKALNGGLHAEDIVRSGWARLLRTRIDVADAHAQRADHTGDPEEPIGWRPQIVGTELQQPDSTTCGPSSLVMARLINYPGYRQTFLHEDGSLDRTAFVGEVTAMHRALSRPLDHTGRPQLPWIPALGIGPWAAARAMSGPGGAGRNGALYRVLPFDPQRREDALAVLTAAVDAGEVVPLFVGNRAMARHVVAVLRASWPDPATAPGADGHRSDDATLNKAVSPRDVDLEYYDPADGALHTVHQADLLAGRAVIAGWSEPWFAIVPAHGSASSQPRAPAQAA